MGAVLDTGAAVTDATPRASEPLLRVEGLGIRFGGVCALQDVSFSVMPGMVCGIIGPNGAGKTTLFNCLSRINDLHEGRIHFNGRDLRGIGAHQVAALGIARTFQNVALFDRQSVRKNVETGCYLGFGGRHFASLFMTRQGRRDRAEIDTRVDELLEFARLRDVAHVLVADLPFGVRKRVELARALAMRPRLLLLDEPAAGLNHEEMEELLGWIRQIRDRMGVAVLLIEHHMSLVMRVCDQVVVLEFGRDIASGTPQEVAANPEVIRAYLGGDE